MAEILVKAVDATHSDPGEDARGCYKRGDPVVVMPDGHPWGAEERLPKFVVIKFPTISREQLAEYCEPWQDRGAEVVRRRLWKFSIDALPPELLQLVNADGELVVRAGNYSGPSDIEWIAFRALVVNQRTSFPETKDLS